MDQDDRFIGRPLSRRELVRLFALGGAAVSLPAGLSHWEALLRNNPQRAIPDGPACVVRPELEEGPFFLDHQLNRSDVRVEPATGELSPGVPLSLTFTVLRAGASGCAPLTGATVDIWQCDAAGVYSGVGGGFGPARGGPSASSESKALRGVQVTDASGTARFTTIYPGWYQGRTVHIHFKVRTTAAPTGAYEFTSQLFFDDALTDVIHAGAPYAARGERQTRNQNDGIFRDGGPGLTLAPEKQADGLAATFGIGLDLSDAAAGRPDGNGGGRGRGRRGF